MLEHVRTLDPNMCDIYAPANPNSDRLENFQIFRKTPFIYSNYPYSNSTYDVYENHHEMDSSAVVYQDLLSPHEHYKENWQSKFITEWTEDDTMFWILDTGRRMGYSELEIPYFQFRIPGVELRNMKREDILHRMFLNTMDPNLSRRIADVIFEKVQQISNIQRDSVLRHTESDNYGYLEASHTVLDLDALDQKNRFYDYPVSDYTVSERMSYGVYDSSDDAEDASRCLETASPVGSDGSKSSDEDIKKKTFKRPPGRPKGSGRRLCLKRPKSVSVPEFLRDLLFDPKHCPSIIRWEDYTQGKFRFVKPDEVAKLWGKFKQNDNMTFEKFSRAMRYHYKQSVLVSVPEARLVYRFGNKGPDIKSGIPITQK